MTTAKRSRWTDTVLLWIFRTFPPREVIFKDPGPRPASEYADETAHPFMRWFGLPSEYLQGKDVLDVGFGFGGRPIRYSEMGARSIAGVEVDATHVETALAFAKGRGVEFDARLGTGEDLPFEGDSFDLVTMYDVLEHVISPRDVLAECLRVLRPGGQLAVVFPPYYHMTAGHHLIGYATTFPGLNLLFTTKALRSATRKHLDQSGWPWREYMRDVPTDKLWNLNGLTVRGFRRLVGELPFEVRTLRYTGNRDHRLLPKSRRVKPILMPAFLLFETLARLPMIREAFCNRIVALLEKPV